MLVKSTLDEAKLRRVFKQAADRYSDQISFNNSLIYSVVLFRYFEELGSRINMFLMQN